MEEEEANQDRKEDPLLQVIAITARCGGIRRRTVSRSLRLHIPQLSPSSGSGILRKVRDLEVRMEEESPQVREVLEKEMLEKEKIKEVKD